MFKQLKKVPHKRKIRNISQKIILLVSVFFATLVFLTGVYLIITLPPHQVFSPLALFGQKFQDISLSDAQAKKIQILLDKYSIAYTEIQPAESNADLIKLKDGEELILSNTKDLEQQITSLQLIMRTLTIEGKRFHRVDFRFDNPVVTY